LYFLFGIAKKLDRKNSYFYKEYTKRNIEKVRLFFCF